MTTVRSERVTSRGIAAVVRFLPSILNGDLRFADVVNCGDDEMECHIPFVPSDRGIDFIRAVEASTSSLQGTLRDWGATREARMLLKSVEAIESADELSLMRLLALHVRADKQVRGHLQEAVNSGHIAAILSRLEILHLEGKNESRLGVQRCN